MTDTTSEKEEKDVNYVKFYREHLETIRYLTDANPHALKVFLLLCEYMNRLNAVVISRQCIGELLGISVPYVAKHLKYLKDHNMIKSVRTGGANVYYINQKIAWANTKDKKKLGMLDARVVFSEEEQIEIIKKKRKQKKAKKSFPTHVETVEAV